MRMAAHSGRTARELESAMGSDELTEWLAFEREYGYPDVYFMTAQVCRAVFLAMTGKSPPPEAFVPYFPPPPPLPVSEQRAILRSKIAAARGSVP